MTPSSCDKCLESLFFLCVDSSERLSPILVWGVKQSTLQAENPSINQTNPEKKKRRTTKLTHLCTDRDKTTDASWPETWTAQEIPSLVSSPVHHRRPWWQQHRNYNCTIQLIIKTFPQHKCRPQFETDSAVFNHWQRAHCLNLYRMRRCRTSYTTLPLFISVSNYCLHFSLFSVQSITS